MSEKTESEPKHTAITGAEVLQQFEDAISGKLSDDNWNEDYTAPASFSIREMREIVRACNSYPELANRVAELEADAKHIAEQLERIGVNPAWHNTGEKAAEHAVTLFQLRESEIEALKREIKHAQDTLLSELERLQPCLAALLAIKEMADTEKDDSYCNDDPQGALETIYQKARAAIAKAQPEEDHD